MIEIWKDIKGYEGIYKVSNIGRVKSLARTTKKNNGKLNRVNKTILKFDDNKSYKRVTLCKNGGTKRFQVHRLVTTAFIPNPLNKPQVNHIDGNPTNNNVENLEWCTQSENMLHAFRTGLQSMNYRKKKVLMLSLDNEPLLWFNSMTEASKNTIPNISHISDCCKGKRNSAGGYKWQYYEMTRKEKLNELKQGLLKRLKNKEIWLVNGKYIIKDKLCVSQ